MNPASRVDRSGGIDFHVHLVPALPGELLDELGIVERDGLYELDGKTVGPRRLYEPTALAGYLSEVGLDAGMVSPSPPLFRQHLKAAESARWVRALNLGMVEMVERDDRLHPLIYLPLEHPDVAIAEFEFFRDHSAVAGWAASSGGSSVAMDSPALEELWAGMNESSEWIFLHPGTSPDRRLDRMYLSNTVGNPVESALAVSELVFGDVLFRYSRLRFMIAHCGGAFPALVGRWQRALDVGQAECSIAPVDAARRFFVDTVAHSGASVGLALSVIGADRLVFGSDWPYPMGVEDPVSEISELRPEEQELVCGENGRSLLGQRWAVAASATNGRGNRMDEERKTK